MSRPCQSPPIERSAFGVTAAGEPVQRFSLRTPGGRVAISEYGATVVSLEVPDRAGEPGHVALGFPGLSSYLGEHPFIGGTVGRYANRIAAGRLQLDGQRFALVKNDGENHLHGGPVGFSRRVFASQAAVDRGAPTIELSMVSPAGDQGYPGRLEVRVRFRLVDEGETTTLELASEATTDAPTVVSLAHHGYFNLRDGGASDVLDHTLRVHAARALPLDSAGIPTGDPTSIAGTRLDFRDPTRLGARMVDGDGHDGYDDCFMLERAGGEALGPAASVREPHSGRSLDVFTDQPAMQLYTGNSLDGSLVGHGAARYRRHAGLCLETQHPPDAPSRPGLPSARLDPGETYRANVHYRFGVHG